ncbi:sarcosine oxidase subunit gamma [Saccharopolyspora antimicrobica]|uniref:Sarcosine oxidase subunit gamma n=1 Tax=Saccharopolyspora antimicrobica TaxID=455193 RepID=A0A1I5CE01_9PSEU|nr:sarcosine oxidase subunit gamma family protein [Saccharopolyspora antimicrobica]RKT88889.1 sarcosine oxidase subunit gamma [Saccharopolyspora antimicrobica]SFN85114.1 sarcosine oxidase subunit gamma [Saccharopolyspora antimicrobica]
MAETLCTTHPLEAWRAALAELTWAVDGLVVKPEEPVAAADLRIDPAGPGAAAVEQALGAALPVQPNTWTATPEGQLIWLGPDEWLVTSKISRPHELEDALAKVVSAHDGAAVDVSAQRTAIRLSGELARELLSFGCSIDLRPAALPRGTCAQTTVGQAGVLIVALGDDFRLFVRPSFAGYLADWLLDAAQEFR